VEKMLKMSSIDEKEDPANKKRDLQGFDRYQKKEALKRMLYYASEEASSQGYIETDKQILIAVAMLLKEYDGSLS